MDEREWAPLLDPEWRREFRGLESALSELVELEHDCPCEVCHHAAAKREALVVALWVGLSISQRQRWHQAWGMDQRGAALRDALAAVGPERLAALRGIIEPGRSE